MAGVRLRRFGYAPILLAVAVDGVSYAILAPVLPAVRERTGVSALAASLVFSGFYAGNIVGFLVGGHSVARWGARPTILAGVVGQALGDLGIAFSSDIEIVGASRALQGLASAAVWMGAVSAAMAGERERMGIRLGAVLAAYSAGALVGTALGALGGVIWPFLSHLALEGVAGVLLATMLPAVQGRSAWGTLRALTDRAVVFACAAVAFGSLMLGMLEGSYTLRFAGRLSQVGLSALYLGATAAYGAGSILASRARTVTGSWRLVQAGLLSTAGLLLAISWASGPGAWFPLVASVGAAAGVAESASLGLLGRIRSGALDLVVYSQAWALGYVLGPGLATTLAERGGWLLPGWVVSGLALLFLLGTLRVPQRSVIEGRQPS